MKADFLHAPLMHAYYERIIVEEEEEDGKKDDTRTMIKEDRINFNYVPLREVVRAVCSIYDTNFKTPNDHYSFCNLVKEIFLNSPKYIVRKQKFDLGYADINFTSFNCPTEKLFPFWKQIASKWEPEEEQPQGENEDNLEIEIEYGYGYNWHSQNIFGEVIFLEGEIEGTETYHRLTIDIIQLNKEDVEKNNDEEDSIKDHEKAGT